MDRTKVDIVEWQVTADIANNIALEAEKHETPTLFVLIPSVFQVDEVLVNDYIKALNFDHDQFDLDQPTRLLTAELESNGLTVIDLTDGLQEVNNQGEDSLYGRIDKHLSPEGHEVAAEILHPYLLESLTQAKQDGFQE